MSEVRRFLLHNRHAPGECGATFAAFKGHASPLRHHRAASSCRTGGHEIWWLVPAPDEAAALALLPRYVAERSSAVAIRDVLIP
jgi:hypothetical protein